MLCEVLPNLAKYGKSHFDQESLFGLVMQRKELWGHFECVRKEN